MKNPLIINIRCSCIEEYINLQKIHKQYTQQLRTGEILSIFVGAEQAVRGEYKVVDELLDKAKTHRAIPSIEMPMAFSRSMTDKEIAELKEEVTRNAVVVNGPMPEEEIALPQAVDGGVDAAGNVPLPEKPLTLDEARAIGAGYAEQEEKSSITEFAIGDRAEEFHYEDEAKPDFGPDAETEVHKSFQHVPETLDNDTLVAVGTEPFSTFGPQEFSQSEPSVTEVADDGADWNNYAN